MGSSPKDPELMNLYVDCPHCGREEWFLAFRDQDRMIVQCQGMNQLDWRNSYVIKYLQQ